MNRISYNNFLRVAAILLFLLASSQICMASEEVPLLPMTVQGTAMVNGNTAPAGTIVAAYLDGEQVGKFQVSSTSGEYCFWISGTASDEGKTVRFTVDGKDTGKFLSWKSGKQVLSLQLSEGRGANSENYIKSLTSNKNPESLTNTGVLKALAKDSDARVIESSVPEPDVDFLRSMRASSLAKESAEAAYGSFNLKSTPGFTIAYAVAGIIVLVFGLKLVRKRD